MKMKTNQLQNIPNLRWSLRHCLQHPQKRRHENVFYITKYSWEILIECKSIKLSPFFLSSCRASLIPFDLTFHPGRNYVRTGSPMPWSGLQVKEMVTA